MVSLLEEKQKASAENHILRVGDLMMRMVDSLHVYQTYYARYPLALRAYQEWRTKSPQFAEFMEVRLREFPSRAYLSRRKDCSNHAIAVSTSPDFCRSRLTT